MTGVFLILAALVALPPAHTFIKKKANVSIRRIPHGAGYHLLFPFDCDVGVSERCGQ